MNKLLVPSSALLWGLQLAFLSPALALILVNLYGATTAEVGWVLGIYNASGFVASLLLPAYADKKRDYLGPMLVCGALTLLLAVVLALVTSLPVATIALVVIGGPPGWAARCCTPTSATPEPDPPTSSTPARSCRWPGSPDRRWPPSSSAGSATAPSCSPSPPSRSSTSPPPRS